MDDINRLVLDQIVASCHSLGSCMLVCKAWYAHLKDTDKQHFYYEWRRRITDPKVEVIFSCPQLIELQQRGIVPLVYVSIWARSGLFVEQDGLLFRMYENNVMIHTKVHSSQLGQFRDILLLLFNIASHHNIPVVFERRLHPAVRTFIDTMFPEFVRNTMKRYMISCYIKSDAYMPLDMTGVDVELL